MLKKREQDELEESRRRPVLLCSRWMAHDGQQRLALDQRESTSRGMLNPESMMMPTRANLKHGKLSDEEWT